MVRLSTLSSMTVSLLSVSYLTSAAPLASDQELKAGVVSIPKRSWIENLSPEDLHRRDIERIQRRNKQSAALLSAGGEVKRSLPAAAALPPFDIAPFRRSPNSKRKAPGSYSDSLKNSQNLVWYGGTNVGTPGQTITIDFDTGSSDLIIPTSKCIYCAPPFFDPTRSSTFKQLGRPFSAEFGDHSNATGIAASDVVTIGTLSFATQTFGLVDYASVGFDKPNSGLMGLAFPAIAKSHDTPWFINLAQEGLLASNLFSFYLTYGNADGSELCIGCTDSTKYSGIPEYFPLVPDAATGVQESWTIDCKALMYNGKIVGSLRTAMVDSGTALILVPPSVAAVLYKNISGAEEGERGQYYVPCDTPSAPFGLMFSSKTVFSIDGSRLAVLAVGDGKCLAAIGSSGVENGEVTVGDAFMTTWYSIFDYGNKRVGFAKANAKAV